MFSTELKEMNTNQTRHTSLPIKRNLKLTYALSLGITLLMAGTSIAGLLYRSVIYPTDELLQTFMPNDVVNLLIGVPILLGSMWLTWRGKLIGLLFWPGALFYVLYNYIAYIFGIPFNTMYPLFLALVTSSVYTIISLIANIDRTVVKKQLAGVVPERAAGGILAGLGALFGLRAIAVMVGALVNQTPIATTEFPVLIADFLVSPAFIIGGSLLWRRKALGYVAGLGLLFQMSTLFIGLIIFMLIQPFLTDASFPLVDVVVVFIMGLVCFIPFGLFVRGVLTNHQR
jgi:hypothetical protein